MAHQSNFLRQTFGLNWRFCLAILTAFLVLFPIIAVVVMSLFPTENIWPHLWSTVFPRYARNTVVLCGLVGAGSLVIGTVFAFLVTQFEFWGRRWLQYALFLPLAVPGYITAIVLVDFLEFAGPLQTHLRGIFGWTTKADYWFPQVRSLGGAALVLTLSLYPYVYLMARAMFRDRSASLQDVALSMGYGHWQIFYKIAVPMARPAIAAGVTIAMMETLSDFGTVEFFAVQTLTTGIFSVWLDSYNAGGAAQLSLTILVLVILLVGLERILRGRATFANSGRQVRLIQRVKLSVLGTIAAICACFTVIGIGFVLPVTLLARHAFASGAISWNSDLWVAAHHSAVLGLCAAVLTTIGAVLVVTALRGRKSVFARWTLRATTFGYAVPGAVLAVGLLIPLAYFDNWVADITVAVFGFDPGLLLTGGIAVLVLAYVVRFFAIGVGAAEGGLATLSPSLVYAARSLGLSQSTVLRRVMLPHITPALVSAGLLVFVDTVKELPATLLLRPFNYETLSSRTFAEAETESLATAAPPALVIVLLCIIATLIVARSHK